MITFNSTSVKALFISLLLSVCLITNAQVTVSTLSGNGLLGYVDGPSINAEFSGPYGVAVDSAGNVYATDHYNNVIRKITKAGATSTLAGTGVAGYLDGSNSSAEFNDPIIGITIRKNGDLYVSDGGNRRIRKITNDGIVSTFCGNGLVGFGLNDGQYVTLTSGGFRGLAFDKEGNLYIADNGCSHIRKILPDGTLTTFAANGIIGFQDGTAANSEFNAPAGLAVDSADNVYVADQLNNRIRKITQSGIVTTFAGDGVAGYKDGNGTSAEFNNPTGLCIDSSGNLYVMDLANYRVRKITPNGTVTTVAGNGIAGHKDGDGADAEFSSNGLTVGNDGTIYTADWQTHYVRKITQGVLPITLLNFSATLNKIDCILKWQTATEINANYFNIQRSDDGLHFSNINKINATGNSSNIISYSYIDKGVSELNISRIYYRLQEIDKDGKSNYSSVKTVNFSSGRSLFSVSPNPSKDFINIVSSYNVSATRIIITDMNGKTLFTTRQNFIAGQQMKISLSQFPSEVLIVTIKSINSNEQFKVIKQ